MRKNIPFQRLLCMLAVLALVLAMVPATVFAEAPETLYLKPNSNWLQANARFAAYFFGNGEKWVSMEDSDGDGIYEVAVPAGYPSVIFCRMNPAATANNWNNKWNQSGDLTVPTDGTNLFTIPTGAWDGSTTGWSTYAYVEPEFTVAGVAGLCGTEWDVTNTANDLTKNAAGLYEKVYTEVAAGTYKFKVVKDHSWDVSYPGSDYSLNVEKDGSTVTVTFDPVTKAVSALVEAPAEPETYIVTLEGSNVTATGAGVVSEGASYTTTLTATEGYILPQTITVTMGGAEAAYTYDAATGTVTVENVTADVVITAVAELEPTEPTYKSASVTLENDIAVNFKVDAANAVAAGYTDLYTVFSIHGMTFTTTGTEKDGLYIYTLRSIQPDWMGDTITAQLYGTKGEETVLLETKEYSIAQYCMNQLAEYDGEKVEKLRTLLVDLLNYGAAAQEYTGYHADALVNAALTQEQKAWGTAGEPAKQSDLTLSALENIRANWVGAALYLRETPRIRLHFTTDVAENVKVVVTAGEQTWTLGEEDLLVSGNHYYVYFDEVGAQDMRTVYGFTVYAGDTQLSQTLTYSVVTYAFNATGAVKPLTDALMRYSDSAVEYIK